MYRLKSNVADFHVVDGPFAGRNFVAGQTYPEIPPGEERRFEAVNSRKPPAAVAKEHAGPEAGGREPSRKVKKQSAR